MLLLAVFNLAGASGVAQGAQETASSSASDLRTQIDKLQRDLKSLNGQIDQWEKKLADLRRQERDVKRSLEEQELELNRTQAELTRAETELEISRLNVEQARLELAEAEQELARRNELLRRRVRAMYELGQVSYLEVLLSARSFSDFVQRFSLLQTIVSKDVSLLESADRQREVVAEKTAQLAKREEEVEAWRDEVKRRKVDVEVQIASRQATLQELQMSEDQYRRELDRMERLSKELETKINDLVKKLHLAEGIPVLAWPVSGWISSEFGNRYHPILREWRLHTGIDIAAPSGRTISAAYDGIVITSMYVGGYGNTVIIAHSSRCSTLYAHCSTLLVSSGQSVSKGQAIARVGSTGLSTGPHLHFEVRIDGVPKNPREYLAVR